MAGEFELDEMKAIVEEFLVESEDLVAQLDTDLVDIEKNPDDPELLNRIFRSAHTIKGTSGFLGFSELSKLTHAMEDVFNCLRKQELDLSAGLMDVLLSAVDHLKGILIDISEHGHEVPRDLHSILDSLSVAVSGDVQISDPVATHSDGVPDAIPDSPKSAQDSSEPACRHSDEIVRTIRDSVQLSKSDSTIRVDIARLDNLMNLVGELVLGRNALLQVDKSVSSKFDDEAEFEKLNQVAADISFISTELQAAVMKMRMLPIGKVFTKFPRIVRNLSRELGKQIELQMSGEATELDKSVIEEIGDPLVHAIRNSCDHGIESPEVRRRLGKPERGTIRLIADREGSHIVVRVVDDGRGLDIDSIAAKAVEKGLANPDDVYEMPDREIMNYIFQPGFSTVTNVSDVSGRGVGMDVVRNNIEKLNGTIELDSEKGRGTTLTMKLPLTLAIIQGLLVGTGNDVFIVPLSSVLETVRLHESDVSSVNHRPVIRLRDSVLPIACLRDLLSGAQARTGTLTGKYVVVVGFAERRMGLLVDELLGQEEVVIKPLGDYLGNIRGIAGATIMGDGRVRLVVDVGGIFNLAGSVR